MQISYNKLKTFGECALKYRLAYIERLPRPALPSLAFHRRLHAALARYHYFAKRDGQVREDDLLSAYAAIWGADENQALRETRSYQEGEEILRRYCQAENEKHRVPAYLEHTLKFPFGPYVLTGKIDRIDFTESRSYAITDYKLDKKLHDHNSAEQSQQLSFYHLLVSEGLGVESEEVRFYYLRHGVEHVSTRSRAQMRDTVAWVDETAAAIHSEKQWQPRQGEGCSTCAFQKVCPTKTGRERPQQPVWQQGDLLWEMTDESVLTASASSKASPQSVRQTTIFDFLE